MTTYAYTGRLTDFGEAPFPGARPRLWVAPMQDAFGPVGGVLASRQILISVPSSGYFSVDLIATADLQPQTKYSLRCEWLDTNGVVRGWSQWDFYAAIGGGPIADMGEVIITRVWYGETPPPVQRAGIYWVNPITGDIREWVEE